MDCTCSSGRPLGMPHESDCPQGTGQVLMFRNPETQRPVAVPQELVAEHERAYKAYTEHLDGKSWDLIAAEGGWPNARACATEVKSYLAEGKAMLGDWKRAELKEMAWNRYEALLSYVMPEAKKGKVQPVLAAMAINREMIKLANLDLPDADGGEGVPTVVVPSDEYIASLKQASGES